MSPESSARFLNDDAAANSQHDDGKRDRRPRDSRQTRRRSDHRPNSRKDASLTEGERTILVRKAAGVKDPKSGVTGVEELDEETGDSASAGADGESGCKEWMVRYCFSNKGIKDERMKMPAASESKSAP